MNKIEMLFSKVSFGDTIPKVRLLYVKDMSPRHHYFAGSLEIGKRFLEYVLSSGPLPEVGDIYLVYPERWMNFMECRHFRDKLEGHPEVSEVRTVSIITSSFEIISSWRNDTNCETLEGFFPKE